jgi:hypothetical protein
MTQREANKLFEGPPVDVADNISNFMVLVMTCIFYSPIIPLAIPLGFAGSFFTYWVYKYTLLRRHKMPPVFSDLMATSFTHVMPIFLVIWGLSFYFFLDLIQKAYHEDFHKALN